MNDTHKFTLEGTTEECPTCGHETKSEHEELKVTIQAQDTGKGGRLVIQFNGVYVASINREGIHRHQSAGLSGIMVGDGSRIRDRSYD